MPKTHKEPLNNETASSSSIDFDDDAPIRTLAEDDLRVSELAHRIAMTIETSCSEVGLVIGVEGDLGAGKTSLVNLVQTSLKKTDSTLPFYFFRPWLVDSRDGLLTELFSIISEAASKVPLKDTAEINSLGCQKKVPFLSYFCSDRVYQRRKLKSQLARYLSTITLARKITNNLSIPTEPISMAANISLDFMTSLAEGLLGDESLETQKENIVNELNCLSKKIVIVIDDLDRLPADELTEVLRLIRAVADFPNIFYILCYSQKHIESCLHKVFPYKGFDDNFLDKFIQIPFSLPKTEICDLREMFRRKLLDYIRSRLNYESVRDEEKSIRRLEKIIYDEAIYSMKTPRCVSQIYNSIILYSSQIFDFIDIGDMVYLQFLRFRNKELYAWLHNYMSTYAQESNGDHISDAQKDQIRQKLQEVLKPERPAVFGENSYLFTQFLRGVSQKNTHEQGKIMWNIFQPEIFEDCDLNRQSKRFRHQNNFRTYFSLSTPEEDTFFEFVNLVESDYKQAAKLLAKFAVQQKNGRVFSLESFYDNLEGIIIERNSTSFNVNILNCLIHGIDEVALTEGIGDFGMQRSWIRATIIFEEVLSKLPRLERTSIIQKFSTGKSIGWLSRIVYDEIFSHGLTGDQTRPVSDRIFTPEELEYIIETMIKQYRQISGSDMIEIPGFKYMFITWLLCGKASEGEISGWIADNTGNDLVFLEWIYGLRGWRSTNGVVTEPLKLKDHTSFLDVDSVKARLISLKNSNDPDVRKFLPKVEAAIIDWNPNFFDG